MCELLKGKGGLEGWIEIKKEGGKGLTNSEGPQPSYFLEKTNRGEDKAEARKRQQVLRKGEEFLFLPIEDAKWPRRFISRESGGGSRSCGKGEKVLE